MILNMLRRLLRGRAQAAPSPALPDKVTAELLAVHELIEAGQLDAAGARAEALAAREPASSDAFFLLGRIAQRRGELNGAIVHFKRALQLRPDLTAAHVQLAIAYAAQNETTAARTSYAHAIAAMPGSHELHHNLGLLQLQDGMAEEAIQNLETAVRLNAGSAIAWNNLGRAYADRSRFERAIDCYQQALRIDTGNIAAKINTGAALLAGGRATQAIPLLETICRDDNAGSSAHIALALAYFTQRRLEDAAARFNRVPAASESAAEARFGLANIALLRGQMREGWGLYEARMQLPRFARFYRKTPPRWQGEPLTGRALLVHSEQGFGDILLFARFLPRLATLGASRIIFHCRPQLLRLLADLRGVEAVAETTEVNNADCTAAILSLPNLLGIDGNEPEFDEPCLKAPSALVEQWRAALATERRLRVGIALSENIMRPQVRGRVPETADYAPLANLTNIAFYHLQPGLDVSQRAALPFAAIDHTEKLKDFADTAALIQHLDLVISIDTSVAHLAGGMGKRVLLLHPDAPDWRWEIAGRDSPWYKNVRLHRRRDNSWQTAIDGVTAVLHAEAQRALKER